MYGHTVGHLDWANSLPGWLTLAPLPGTPPNLFVPQAWTLTYELTFYAVFALLFLLPQRAAGLVPAVWSAIILLGCLWNFESAERKIPKIPKHFPGLLPGTNNWRTAGISTLDGASERLLEGGSNWLS